MSAGCVYFISAGENFAIKIGFTAGCPHRRAHKMSMNSPVRLLVLASTPGGKDMEAQYHRRFERHRLHGEWFAPHEDIWMAIQEIRSTAAVKRAVEAIQAGKRSAKTAER